MNKLPDGTVISQFFKTTERPESGDDVLGQGVKIVVGQVDKVHFVDDASNVSKTHVEYDVIVRDAAGGQSTLRNLRKGDSLGGANDHDEVVLEPNEHATSGSLNSSNFFKNKNGTVVLVACTDGSKERPQIVGALQHPRRKGSKRSDGVRRFGEFKGVQWEVSKDGELTVTYLGGRSPDGKLKRPETGPTQVKIDRSGALRVTDNAGQRFEMSREAKTITLSNGVTITLDGSGDSFTILTAGGAKVTVDGAGDSVKAETSGGAKVTVDGASGEVSAEDGSGGKLKIKDGKVGLGAAAAEVVDVLSRALDALSLTTAPGFGAPISSVATFASLKAEIDQIKGGI